VQKELLSKSTLMLEVQTVAFLKPSLRWRYKQLLSKSTPTLVAHLYTGGTTLSWWYKQLLHKSTPYAGGKNSCFSKATPTLQVKTVAF